MGNALVTSTEITWKAQSDGGFGGVVSVIDSFDVGGKI